MPYCLLIDRRLSRGLALRCFTLYCFELRCFTLHSLTLRCIAPRRLPLCVLLSCGFLICGDLALGRELLGFLLRVESGKFTLRLFQGACRVGSASQGLRRYRSR